MTICVFYVCVFIPIRSEFVQLCSERNIAQLQFEPWIFGSHGLLIMTVICSCDVVTGHGLETNQLVKWSSVEYWFPQ